MIKDKEHKLEYIELLRDDYGYNVNGWNTNDPFVSIIWGNTIYSDTRENIINALVVEDNWKREFLESKSNLELLNFYKEAFGDEILDDDMDLNTVETLDRWYNDQVEEDLIPLDLTEEDEELIEDDNNIIDLEKQKEAVKILEKNPKAYAVIYGYTTPDDGIKYLNPMLKKYSQEEVEEYENSFRNGKAASDTIIHVVYRSQLGKYKKDEDPKSELLEKIKNDCIASGKKFRYDPNFRIIGWFDGDFDGMDNKELAQFLKEPLEEIEKLPDDKLMEILNEVKNDFWNTEYALNNYEGIKYLQEQFFTELDEWDLDEEEDNSVNDSKQKEICDSFGNRYKKH